MIEASGDSKPTTWNFGTKFLVPSSGATAYRLDDKNPKDLEGVIKVLLSEKAQASTHAGL